MNNHTNCHKDIDCQYPQCVSGLGTCSYDPKISSTPQSTIHERESTHGDWSKQSATAQFFKRECRGGNKLTDSQHEAMDMIAVKLSRIIHGNPNEPDHWLDLASYSMLEYNRLKGIKSGDVK